MREIKGKYNRAKVFTDVVDHECVEQILGLLDLDVFQDTKVRIMPDCHVGASCVIGFTANLGDKIIPNIVGGDIGCVMLTVELGRMMRFPELQDMYCYRELQDTKNMERAIGSLGGGNHFIEVDVDNEGNKYLIIHTGSRKSG